MAKHDPDLSLLFHALSDPTRRAILTRLASGPAPVTELANPTGLRLPTVIVQEGGYNLARLGEYAVTLLRCFA
jgi:DNA-binding transcriptional ArsR family regulator